MARFWVGGTGTWDASTTTHWSSTTGGSGGASVPTAADDVVFDASSGAGTATLAATVPCRSIDGSLSSISLSTNNNGGKLVIGDASGGAFSFAAGKLVNAYAGAVSTFQFVSTSTNGGVGWPITTNGNTMGPMLFNGVGGRWQLQDNVTGTIGGNGDVAVVAGTFDTNNKNISSYWQFSSTGALARTLNFGSSVLTFLSTGSPWAISGSNVTLNAGTSSIVLSGAMTGLSTAFAGGSLTYYDVSFTGGGVNANITGTNTFHNLTIAPTASNNSSTFLITTTTVTNAFTVTGHVSPNRIIVSPQQPIAGVTGVPVTITVNGSFSLSNTDFQDITAAGTAGTWSGTNLGDCLGNSNITFPASVDRYFVGGAATGNWSDNKWSTTDGGSTGASVPLPQDNVFLTANSFSGTRTFNLDQARLCKNFDATGLVSTTSIARGNSVNNQIFGSLKLPALANFNTAGGNFVVEGRGTHTVTTGGNTINGGFVINAPGGTYTLQDNGTFAANTTLVQGTWDENGKNVTYNNRFISSTLGSTRTWIMSNGGTTTIGSASSALGAISAVMNIANITGFTLVSTGSNLVFAKNSDNFQKQFTGLGLTWGNVTINSAAAGGLGFDFLGATGATVYGTMTIGSGLIIRLSGGGGGYTSSQWSFNGTAALPITEVSLNSPSRIIFSQPSGTVTATYINLKDTNATGGATYIASPAIDSGNNIGWLFPSGFGQALADIKAISRVFAQSQADIKATGSQFAQAQSDIKAIGSVFAQSQSWIERTEAQSAQAQSDILATYLQSAQAQADILATSTGFGQSQADILATLQRLAQAQADILATSNRSGQAQADVKAISSGFAQAQSDILAKSLQAAQAQADILVTSLQMAQTQALIKRMEFGRGQTQADIKALGFAFGQAIADIKAISQLFAQAQADIKATSATFGQAKANIKATSDVFAQVQSLIKRTENAYSQAQSDIKATSSVLAMAQADIVATSIQSAQAQARVVYTRINAANAQAYIKLLVSMYGQAQAHIFQIHFLKNLALSDEHSLSLKLSDTETNKMVSVSDEQGKLFTLSDDQY